MSANVLMVVITCVVVLNSAEILLVDEIEPPRTRSLNDMKPKLRTFCYFHPSSCAPLYLKKNRKTMYI
ncbi:hypothetical protein L596_002870 [Steinernema carpocapsae]|uniref:Uncharacterized protein n=1 Tax=Steinernema carpocapsae TaxID=34508 RepID=A0A4U8URE0_STECR|nr:hypothetical protein L596_002870 [Steinernema carpocapsae]